MNWHTQILRAMGSNPDPIVSKIVPITVGGTTLFEIDTPGIYKIWIKNIGSNSATACTIDCRNSPLASWKTIVSTTNQFTTLPASIHGFLVSSDDTIDPPTLAAGEEWNGTIDATKFNQVRMTMTGNTRIQLEVW